MEACLCLSKVKYRNCILHVILNWTMRHDEKYIRLLLCPLSEAVWVYYFGHPNVLCARQWLDSLFDLTNILFFPSMFLLALNDIWLKVKKNTAVQMYIYIGCRLCKTGNRLDGISDWSVFYTMLLILCYLHPHFATDFAGLMWNYDICLPITYLSTNPARTSCLIISTHTHTFGHHISVTGGRDWVPGNKPTPGSSLEITAINFHELPFPSPH